MRFSRRSLAVSTALALMGGLIASPALAVPDPAAQFESDIEVLLTTGPGLDHDMVLKQVEQWSKDTGRPKEDLAREAVIGFENSRDLGPAQVENSHGRIASDSSEVSKAVKRPLSSGGGGTKVPARAARQAGDFYVSSNVSLGISHGHTAIFNNKQNYVESPGVGKVVQTVNASTPEHPGPIYKYYVGYSAPSANKQAAANFALSKRGKPYNTSFFNNKYVNDNQYNCSQLVWAAWKSRGIDLDGNGGPGVYPWDLPKSSWAHLYGTVTR